MKRHYYTDAILEICTDKHVTVDEIYSAIVEKFPNAGKSSIYRNVEEMAKKGDLVKMNGIGSKAYFEKCKGTHAHFICKKTGKIQDVCLSEFELPKNLPKNFTIKDVDIRVYGEFK